LLAGDLIERLPALVNGTGHGAHLDA
jgi:hypothetical protein